MPRKPDTETLKGKRFGKLVTIEKFNETDKCGRPRVYWLCRCDCGNTKKIRQEVLGKKSNSCGEGKCTPKPPTVASNKHHLWKGYGEIPSAYISKFQHKKRHRKYRKFKVTPKFLWELFLKQNRCCALTGLPLQFSCRRQQNKQEQTASLDRIDSDGDYTEDNVQWIHKDVNWMKSDFSQERFVEICHLVAKMNPLDHSRLGRNPHDSPK